MCNTTKSNVLEFQKRKRVQIEPELKEFLDKVVIALLVNTALEQLWYEGVIEKPH
jgi:hypothetical protein